LEMSYTPKETFEFDGAEFAAEFAADRVLD